jgi:hypothetical protein
MFTQMPAQTSQVGEQCYDLEELDLKQCSGNEMLDVQGFAALCDGCRQLKTVDLVGLSWIAQFIVMGALPHSHVAVQVGIMTLKDKQLECMYHLGSSLRRVRLGGNICLSPSTIATFLQRAGKNLLELDLAGCQVDDKVLLLPRTPCRLPCVAVLSWPDLLHVCDALSPESRARVRFTLGPFLVASRLRTSR